jgi:hypothetical protein
LCGFAHGQDYNVYSNNLAAIERGIKERIFYVDYGSGFVPPVKPLPNVICKSLKDVEAYFEQVVQYATPMTARQFAGSYVGRRRTNYERACDSLDKVAITGKDAYVSSFVKAEKYNFTAKTNPAPRIIQPRGPRYIVESGRYIKPIEKKIYKHINTMFGSTTIFKGLNAEQRGQAMRDHWLSFDEPVAIGLDAKRFDQHVSVEALQWEHSIYRKFYPGDKFFAQLLYWQLVNTGYARCREGIVKYKSEGCRMSGDVNTALGNCLLMSSLVYAYAKVCDVKIRLANDGDDCVVVLEKRELNQFKDGLGEWFVRHGFSMTVEVPVAIFEQIEFCQSHPVWDGAQYIMVRDPRVAISKDCVAIKPLDNHNIRKMWCAAVGQGGMSLTGGIPVWQDFYAQLITLSQGAKELVDQTMNTGMKLLAKGMYRTYVRPTAESRYSFYLAFGIAPTEQVCLEEYYSTMQFRWDGESPRFIPLPLH